LSRGNGVIHGAVLGGVEESGKLSVRGGAFLAALKMLCF